MQKKKLITILLTVILFLSACVLTATTVYRVSAVTLEISVISEEAKTEVETLEKEIAKRYKKENIFFVSEREARVEFEKYPHLRITDFRKSYPNRLIIKGTEDAEVYAVKNGEGFYILGADGTLLCERNSLVNRSDGQNNLLLDGLTINGEKGKIPTDEEFSTIFSFCQFMDENLGGIRANVALVTLEKPTSRPEDFILVLTTREGVEMVVYNPSENTQIKAESLARFYKDMPTVDRLSGKIFVSDSGKCSYVGKKNKYFFEKNAGNCVFLSFFLYFIDILFQI